MKTETWTAKKIKAGKGARRIVCLTAADCSMARIMDEAGVHLILVGDSLAMTVLGYETTLPVTVDEMLHHTAAVVRGTRRALVVADMPFMSYQVSAEQALANAGRFLKEAGAGAVKVEGGAFRAPLVRELVRNGIPVLGHIGLTPQSVRERGYAVQGRKSGEARALIEDAKALEKAGVFAIVLECMPAGVGRAITRAVRVPTIGIGAGPHCDGQILVTSDMLGLYSDLAPKFVKRYAELGKAARRAFQAYAREVEAGKFPNASHTY
jgi:3-methyl-2-oxobutanoate hydroxymethyltransferase